MATRIVEWKKPYTWGKAIEIDENKVISLRLREENNLIIWDEWDNEIYVDLQLPDGVKPLDAFPVWVNVWRVLIADDWDVNGTLVVFKTTSGDNIKLLYWDDWKLYIDNWTGLFKQIYLKWEVDALLQALKDYTDAQLALKQDILIAWEYIEIEDNVISAVIPTMSRFLSIWNASTGQPISFPASVPFTYHTWDYYLVENVDTVNNPPVNYRPDGIEYTGDVSHTLETDLEIADWDVYIYDGSVWLLQENHNKTVAFANIAWDPYDNTNLSTALNAKQDTLVNQSNIKSINNNSLLGSWDLSIAEVPSWWTNGQVLTQTQNGPSWENPTWWGSDIEYVTQAEYTALLPWAASDGKHYFIYSSSVTPTDRPDITNATSDNKSVVVTATWELQGFCLSTDWLNLYYSDYAWKTINQYSLSTAWDISTATDSSKLFNVWEEVSWVFINNSWNKMFLAIGGIWITEYTLSTPYDVSTASLTNTLSSGSNLTWIWISSDWTKLYYMNYSSSTVREYLLPIAWSLTWATLVWDISYPVSWITYRDCAVSPLNKVYLVRQQSTSTIYQMDMATSQDITTATYNNVDLSLSFEACWIYIKPDGSKMYIGDIRNKTIYQYSL